MRYSKVTYSSTELSKLSGIELNQIAKILRRKGFSPVSSGQYNCLEWQEECLEVLLKKNTEDRQKDTILLSSLASIFNNSVDNIRKILESMNIYPVQTFSNIYGSKYERYSFDCKRILEKYFESQQKDDDENIHPLVTDKRWLKLNNWPDIVPQCFTDLDKEVICL